MRGFFLPLKKTCTLGNNWETNKNIKNIKIPPGPITVVRTLITFGVFVPLVFF